MIRKTLILSLFLVFTACTPLVTNTPPPVPEPIRVAYPPSLSNWQDELHACALQTPEIALTILETSPSDLEFEAADLTLWFGEPPQGVKVYAATLGTDEITIIAGQAVNLTTISAAQLRAIYLQAEGGYQAWTYGEGNELRLIFDRAFLEQVAPSAEVWLAPNPEAMLEAMAANPRAIGYLPKAWLDGEIKTLPLTEPLQVPILAITPAEPTGALRNYLVCLQQGGE
jgi:hypothetical protein